MSTVREELVWAEAVFTEAGVPDAKNDAGLLLSYVLKIDRMQLLLNASEKVPEDRLRQFRSLSAKRARRVPLQHLTGMQSFYGLDFHVDERVLIPRPETETLAEYALKQLKNGGGSPTHEILCRVGGVDGQT